MDSSKYTSEVRTTRGTLGTQILYAPGVVRLRPRFTPTQARGSMRVFEYAWRGLTANARQPKGSIGMIRGLSPVSDSKDKTEPRVVQLCGSARPLRGKQRRSRSPLVRRRLPSWIGELHTADGSFGHSV
eukprot:2199909-Pleurochrysis_carterae.AAC.2